MALFFPQNAKGFGDGTTPNVWARNRLLDTRYVENEIAKQFYLTRLPRF